MSSEDFASNVSFKLDLPSNCVTSSPDGSRVAVSALVYIFQNTKTAKQNSKKQKNKQKTNKQTNKQNKKKQNKTNKQKRKRKRKEITNSKKKKKK